MLGLALGLFCTVVLNRFQPKYVKATTVSAWIHRVHLALGLLLLAGLILAIVLYLLSWPDSDFNTGNASALRMALAAVGPVVVAGVTMLVTSQQQERDTELVI